MIEYKGYIGVYKFDEEKNLFHGKVAQIEDLVTFQGKSLRELQESFEKAVNDYMAWCDKYRNSAKIDTVFKEEEDSGGG